MGGEGKTSVEDVEHEASRAMRTAGISAIGILGVAAVIYLWPHMEAGLTQSGCEFGTVSNGQYRAMEREALRKEWPPFDFAMNWQDPALDAQIQQRIDDMLGGRASLEEEVAAIHATMRSMGAFYRATWIVPYKGTIRLMTPANPVAGEDAFYVRYAYHMDANRFRFFVPFRRWITVFVQYSPDSAPRNYRVVAFVPTLLDPSYVSVDRSPESEACPVLPEDIPNGPN